MEDIGVLLNDILEESRVPSLAAAVVFGNEVRAASAVGVRKRGDATPVTLEDKYHIGSCTKAMTASLAGILVERGTIAWDSSIRDVFPDMPMHKDYEAVTLLQLLSHTAGVPSYTDPTKHNYAEDAEYWAVDRPAEALRRELVLPKLLSHPPEAKPGTTFAYSNMGYITAGAMLEQLTETSFETLLDQEYFSPLGIATGGFGAPGLADRIDAPYGHDPEPVEPGPEADNLPIFSPAGTVHMSTLDLAKHAAFHLTGEPKLVSGETLERLHTPVQEGYALGWAVGERKWAGGIGLNHAGSNTLFMTLIGIAPAKDKALVCSSNQGPEVGETACVALFQALTKAYF